MMDIFKKLFRKDEQTAPEQATAPMKKPSFRAEVLKRKDIYVYEQRLTEPAFVKCVELTEQQAVAAGWSFRKKTKAIRITNYHGSEKDLIIPAKIGGIKVNEIGQKAFWGAQIRSLLIPESIKKIGTQAFSQSTLNWVVFGDGVQCIPEHAFAQCTKLEHVHLPLTLITIGSGAFRQCSSLQFIQLPHRLFTIEDEAFYQSGLTGFSGWHIWLRNGSAFAETPLHRNYKLLTATHHDYSNADWYRLPIPVLLVGKNAKFRFPDGCNVELVRNAVYSACALDFSGCRTVRFQESYDDRRDDYGIRMFSRSCKAIAPAKTRHLYFPDYVDATYPDGTPYPGICEITESEQQDRRLLRIKATIHSNHLPSWFMLTGAEEIEIQGIHGLSAERYAFHEKYLKRLRLKRFTGGYELFTPYCVALHEVSWDEFRDEVITKYIPPAELVTREVHAALLQAFRRVVHDVPREYGKIRHMHTSWFFDSSVIDKVFADGFVQYTDHLHHIRRMTLSQSDKILIALDVLRSTQRSYDSSTEMYLQYLQSHRRYAGIVCRKLLESYPEYDSFFRTLPL